MADPVTLPDGRLREAIKAKIKEWLAADTDFAAWRYAAAELEALLASPLHAGAEPEAKAPKEFFNTKWGGKGFGGAGDYRVIVRTERKGSQRTYVQIIDDSDGVGLGFTARQIPAILEALQAAYASLALSSSRTAPQ